MAGSNVFRNCCKQTVLISAAIIIALTVFAPKYASADEGLVAAESDSQNIVTVTGAGVAVDHKLSATGTTNSSSYSVFVGG